MQTNQTNEIAKKENFQVSYLCRRLDEDLNTNHPCQRYSGRWSNAKRYTLITSIAHHYPIPEIIIAEQSDGTRTIHWLIDGLQRLTITSSYRNNEFRIGKNAERPIVRYQEPKRDEDGEVMRDENGAILSETKEFDMTGKYYKDLPKQIQDAIDSFNITAVIYMNCSDDDIEYHIRRYNSSASMNSSEKGITYVGKDFARLTKTITQNNDFLRDKCAFKPSSFNNGTIERVVLESIMNIFFLDNWKGSQPAICSYIKDHAQKQHFDHFKELLERLDEVITDDVKDMFTNRDAFLWFGLFDRFIQLGLNDDSKFIDFLVAFKDELHSKEVDGECYDAIVEKRMTKEKSIVTKKMKLFEALMDEYFKVGQTDSLEEFNIENKEIEKYIEAFNYTPIIESLNVTRESDKIRMAMQSLMLVIGKNNLSDKAIQSYINSGDISSQDIDDVSLFTEILNDLTVEVNNDTKIFDKKYIPSLIKLVSYTFEKEYEQQLVVDWLKHFSENCMIEDLSGDCKKNAEYMISRLDEYITYQMRKSA